MFSGSSNLHSFGTGSDEWSHAGSRVALNSPVTLSDCRRSALTQEDQAMRSTDERDGNAPDPSPSGFVDPIVEDGEEQERPYDALNCPLLDTPVHFDDCKVCHGRGWVVSADIDAYLGRDEVPCVSCGGEGSKESGGPVTWTCTTCLGTGFMPVSLLAQFDLTKYPFYDQDWRDADVSEPELARGDLRTL